MISCPKCSATLPDWAQTCQFCQTDVKKVPRPVSQTEKPRVVKKGWVWPVYYALSAYWMLNGVYTIVIGLGPILRPKADFGALSVYFYGTVAIGLFTFLVGLGLALHVELARGIANFLAGLKIIFGLMALAGSVFGAAFGGMFGLLMVFVNIFDIAAAGFAIYLIGETQTAMPNL